jgi:hypothetical protein
LLAPEVVWTSILSAMAALRWTVRGPRATSAQRGSPNRYGLPAFYELHVWAWRENPNGSFVDWHPHVICDGYTGR